MGDDRRPTYVEVADDGTERRIWRASSLGACERSLVAHALELPTAPTPAAIQRAYDAGSSAEDEIIGHVTDITSRGWKLLGPHDKPAFEWVESGGTGGLQVTVEIVVGKVAGVEQVIRCHPDGIVRKWKTTAQGGQGEWEWTDDPLHEERVVEAKFLRRGSPYTSVAKARASRFYAWQTSVEMHATGLGLIMAVGWKVKGDDGAERVDSVDIQTFDEPMYKLGQVKARVFKLARMVEDAMENGLAGVECDWAMYPCAFHESHDGQRVWVKAADKEEGAGLELGADGLTRLTALAGRVEKYRMMEERYKQQKQAASEELRVALEECGGERSNTYRVGDFTVQWKYTPAKEAEEKVVQYKARAESESVVVKQASK